MILLLLYLCVTSRLKITGGNRDRQLRVCTLYARVTLTFVRRVKLLLREIYARSKHEIGQLDILIKRGITERFLQLLTNILQYLAMFHRY